MHFAGIPVKGRSEQITSLTPPRSMTHCVGHVAHVPPDPIRPVRRACTRLAENRYRCTQGDFTAELVVDEQGLVLDYEGLWRAVARV
jgi:hypothetical protein